MVLHLLLPAAHAAAGLLCRVWGAMPCWFCGGFEFLGAIERRMLTSSLVSQPFPRFRSPVQLHSLFPWREWIESRINRRVDSRAAIFRLLTN
jgi:hypothetical protein